MVTSSSRPLRFVASRSLLVAALLCAVGASGCGWIKTIALDMTGSVLIEGSKALNEEPDYEIVRIALPANLKTVEVMMAANPGNLDMLYMAGQGFAAYTYLVIEDDIDQADAAGDAKKVAELKARALALYLRAQNYTAQLNRTKDTPSTEVRKILETGTPDQIKVLLAKFVKKDVPGLFWYTFSWVGQVNLDQSNPARISDLPRIEAPDQPHRGSGPDLLPRPADDHRRLRLQPRCPVRRRPPARQRVLRQGREGGGRQVPDREIQLGAVLRAAGPGQGSLLPSPPGGHRRTDDPPARAADDEQRQPAVGVPLDRACLLALRGRQRVRDAGSGENQLGGDHR